VIEELRIRGLGVIDDAVLELAPGLTVVTGETGAGKTMVVTGLGLLLGGRGDSGAVRAGAPKALVEGRILLPAGTPALADAERAGAELDDGVLLLARAVSAEGRSRAWLGGQAVPVGTLSSLAESLVAVHGQSDQQRLLQPAWQRAALDRYAGEPVTSPLAEYRTAYARLRAVEAEHTELTTRARERAQEADLLRHGVGAVEAARPQPGEDHALDAESARLSHADALRLAAATAQAALTGDDAGDSPDALGLVAVARRTLDQVRALDPTLGGPADQLAEVAALVADAASQLAAYAESVDADPTRLAAVEERRAVLKGLIRTYAGGPGGTVDDVVAWAAKAADRLHALDGADDRIADLTAERAALVADLTLRASAVSAARREAAERFGAAATAELVELAMPHAVVSVRVTDTGELGPHGTDEVELQLVPHPGAPARSLARGASGGELSRVMLAVEVVFAGADPVPTFVFDEVDAGVGGRAAVEVGRRLARLARSAQVLVVTHLPQVAAFADRHLVVHKASDGSITRSGVTALDDAGRVGELTRMLAGLEGSESGRAHAEELLAAAAATKTAG